MFRWKSLVAAAGAALCCSAMASAQTTPAIVPDPLRDAVLEELSGEMAHANVARITQFERIQASEGWHAAAEWVQGELKRFGYTDAAIESWPSNGDTTYFTWRTPIGWRARSGELWVLEPERRRLGRYEEIANSLIKHSRSANATAELVDVGAGTSDADYEGKDVRGKIVLASGQPGAVHAQAITRRGALGMVGWYPPEVHPEEPDLVRYTAFWPRWRDRDGVGFGFNVSKRDGLWLSNQLRRGQKVVVKADVDAELYESRIEMLTATLPGETAEEFLLMAHLDHPRPSANDNASGAGGLLEMARTLKRLVDTGVIAKPKRTIRFLWVSEYTGTAPYLLHHPEVAERVIASINCDMIGEDLVKTGAPFNLARTPDSMRSWLNDLVENLTVQTADLPITSLRGSRAPFNYRITPYRGGSDHMFFNDGAIGVPSVMFWHDPDPYHHTSQDTLDKVDPTELKRIGYIAVAAALYAADAGDTEAVRLAEEVTAKAGGRLGAELTRALRETDAAQAQNIWRWAVERERESVLAARRLAASEAARARIATLAAAVDAQAAALQPLLPAPPSSERSAEERTAAARIPVRAPTFKAPLQPEYLSDTLGGRVALGLPNSHVYEAVNFVDGTRSLLDIRDAISAELGVVPIAQVVQFFEVLERARLVSFR